MSDNMPHMSRRHRKDDDPKMIGLWKIGRTIGKGSSGRVRIARHSRTGQYAAVKIVSKQVILSSRMSLRDADGEAERILHGIEREIVIMKLIEHPNIMRLYDVWETSTELFLILEYVEGGELFEYLCDKGRLSTNEALDYFQQIITAVDYCHRFNIAHRDLKPENLLLDANKNIKVADFGMAAWQGKSDMLQTACGSPHYAAPEVIMGRAYNGACSDVWSCGVILYALLAGRLPFDDEDLATLLEKVKIGKFSMPSTIEPLAQDLIRKMLEKDISKRITVSEILKHPFYTSQPPKVIPCDIPGLDDIARPLTSEADVDRDILANLRTLWPGVDDEQLIENLTNTKQTWEKGIYHLLVRYRSKHLENYEEDEEERQAERRRAKRTRSRKKAQRVKIALEELPPRAGPPTPTRARRGHSDSAEPSRLRQMTAIGSDMFITEPERTSTLTPAEHAVAPPLTRNINTTAVAESAEPLQDERIQQFFKQIVDHLNVMQIGKPQPSPILAPAKTTPPPPLTVDLGSPFKVRNQAEVFSPLAITPGPSRRDLGTRPLSIRRRERERDDKENSTVSYADSSFLTVRDGPGPGRKSSVRSDTSATSSTRRERHVQLLEPLPYGRSRLQKKHSVSRGHSPSSFSAYSGMSEGSYFFSATPKRSWFGGIFRFGPASYQLYSTQDACATRQECRRILENMGVSVMLLQADGMGVLKCRLEEMKDPVGIMATVKSVKFRVELKIPQTVQAIAGYTVLMNIVMEKGAISSFKLINSRLRREWDLDAPPLGRTMDSRTLDAAFDHERFVEVTYA
ncbi:hypothetical protein EIP86_007508 [Pleurotus ostreatoroseus]|nr:hypothetical protein EIP86_007508 [Pleurotus ostreatoroseus]